MHDSMRLEHFLTYRLHRVARLSDRETAAAYMTASGLGVTAARCLAAIGSFEPLSVNDLARRANQDKGQASRSVKVLVEGGLVVKHTSTADARGVVLTLTRRGRALHTRIIRLIAARNTATFAVLNATERKTLGEMLDRVALANEPA